MSKRNETGVRKSLKWVTERETAFSLLDILVKLGKASRYDLASQTKFSYATVMNYIEKFKEAGLVKEIGEVEAKRGGKKTIYEPTQRALDLISESEPSVLTTMEIRQPTVLNSVGFYSLGTLPRKERMEKKRVQDILNEMRVDVAVVVNYKGHPIPIIPISTLGGIDQAGAIFSEELKHRINEVAIKVAEKIIDAEKS